MDPLLKQLAERVGIYTEFHDAGMERKDYFVEDSIVKFFARKLGYRGGSVQEITKSLDDLDKRRWQRTLESISIVKQSELKIDVVIPLESKDIPFTLELKAKHNAKYQPINFHVVDNHETYVVGKTTYTKLDLWLDTPLEVGYYDLAFKLGHKHSHSVLAVAPERCYYNDSLTDRKLWGYAIQLYSLRSKRNWGIGDFTDLATLVNICARAGADIIGLNPLNVNLYSFPEEASPYQSISRLFLNPIYIDIDAVPEFTKADKKAVQARIDKLQKSTLIDYTGVSDLKHECLRLCYQKMKKSPKRLKEFQEYCKAKGADLEHLSVFQALYEEKGLTHWGGWRAWEPEFKTPCSLAVRKYAKENEDRVNYFKFLQFEAERQFNLVNDLVKKSGLAIGLYQDLAVGVGTDSVEVWSEPDLFIEDAGAGAPPDAFFPFGQRWGLGAFNPYVLKDRAYEPFIKIVRAAMQNSGAIRMDHVMSLTRLYVIPEGEDFGTYIKYNFEDMLNIVAIESHLNQCMVVGESIGNVPEGFIETIRAHNLYELSVLWSERWDAGWGNFKTPHDYPTDAFVSVGTHDMPPLRMWWFGYDIALQQDLGLLQTSEEVDNAYKRREVDRWKLLSAMDSNNVWPRDNMRLDNYIYGQGYPEGIEEAVHKYIASCNSKVLLAELENILHVDRQQNFPGVDRDKHPNWRRKLPVNLEDLENDVAYVRNIAAIKSER